VLRRQAKGKGKGAGIGKGKVGKVVPGRVLVGPAPVIGKAKAVPKVPFHRNVKAKFAAPIPKVSIQTITPTPTNDRIHQGQDKSEEGPRLALESVSRGVAQYFQSAAQHTPNSPGDLL
jgi:hypothetical protein